MYIQSACLQFINALICYPDDIDFRIHLRNEFVRHGLLEVIEVISYLDVLYCFIQKCIFSLHYITDYGEGLLVANDC